MWDFTSSTWAISLSKWNVLLSVQAVTVPVGKRAIIRKAFYGGKASCTDLRNHLRYCMSYLNFKSCLADLDDRTWPAIKSDGNEHYERVFLYPEDELVASENAEHVIRDKLEKCFELKQESVGPPKFYQCGYVRKVTLDYGLDAWEFSSSQHVNAAIKTVEDRLKKIGMKIPGREETPLRIDCIYKLNISADLGAQEAT